ncbi:MAG: HAD-IIA family hydrolase [Candidatus Helarchaeota archaeon]
MSTVNSSNVNIIMEKRLFILDLDGTVYLSGKPFPSVKEFLNYLTEQKKTIMFITNNSSKSFKKYLTLLQDLFGDIVTTNSLFSSTQSTITSLKARNISTAYIVATPEVITDFEEGGVKFTEKSPQAVVITFDTTLTYEKLRKATGFINSGIEYFMTHADLVCPTPEGYIPDAGSIMALIEKATQKKPAEICGKPNRQLIENILQRFSVDKSEVVLFGDRLYTDIKMANENDILSVLVLTGESSMDDLTTSSSQPNFVLKNFQELTRILKID